MILRVGARPSFPCAGSKGNGRPTDGVLELISLDRIGRLRVRKRPAIEKAQLRHLAASVEARRERRKTRDVSNNETTARYLNDSEMSRRRMAGNLFGRWSEYRNRVDREPKG